VDEELAAQGRDGIELAGDFAQRPLDRRGFSDVPQAPGPAEGQSARRH
jgi:hypothetical protein